MAPRAERVTFFVTPSKVYAVIRPRASRVYVMDFPAWVTPDIAPVAFRVITRSGFTGA